MREHNTRRRFLGAIAAAVGGTAATATTVSASTGQAIDLPVGTRSGLSITNPPGPVAIRGKGVGVTIVEGNVVVRTQGGRGRTVTVSDLEIRNGRLIIEHEAFTPTQVSRVHVDRLASGGSGGCIQLKNTIGASVRDCHARGGSYGIWISGDPWVPEVTPRRSLITRIDGCLMSANTTAFYASGNFEGLYISACEALSCDHGFRLMGTNAPGTQITGCHAAYSKVGIWLDSMNTVAVSDCLLFRFEDPSGAIGVLMRNNGSWNRVIGTHFHNMGGQSSSYGVVAHRGGGEHLIAANIFHGPRTAAIRISEGTNRVRAAANQFFFCTPYQTFDTSGNVLE